MREAYLRANSPLGPRLRTLSRRPNVTADAENLRELIAQRGKSWVERVASSLHRAYAPGRTWGAR